MKNNRLLIGFALVTLAVVMTANLFPSAFADAGNLLTKVVADVRATVVVREVEPAAGLDVTDLDGNPIDEIVIEIGFYTEPQSMTMGIVNPSEVRITNTHSNRISLKTPCELPIVARGTRNDNGNGASKKNWITPDQRVVGYLLAQGPTSLQPLCRPDGHGSVERFIVFQAGETKEIHLFMDMVYPPPDNLPKHLAIEINGIFTGFAVKQ